MVHSVAFGSFLHDLFSPLPETESSEDKDPLDHVADYASSSTGAWDVFRVGEHVLKALQLHLSPSHEFADIVGKASELFNTAGIGLSIPQFFSDINSLRHRVIHFFSVQDLPYSDPLRDKKIAQAAKRGFLDVMNLTNTVAQIALFIDGAKLFLIDAARVQVIDGIYNLTAFITDGAELIGECFKLGQYHSPMGAPRTPSEAIKLEQKKTLAWITIAKAASSVALAAVARGALVLGVTTSGIPYVTAIIFGTSAFWLTMKLTSYFYDKIVVEAPLLH